MKNLMRIIIVIVLIFLFSLLFTTKPKQHQITNSQIPSPTVENMPYSISTGTVPEIPFSLPPEFGIHIFTDNLSKPRVLRFSPGGTLLVSDIDENQIIALSDPNHTGVVTSQKVIIDSGNHIHGFAFYNNFLYVAEVDKVVRYSWNEATLTASFNKILFSLPANNNHNNRTITFNQKGDMFVSIGSTCNVCMENSAFSGSVIISNSNGDNPRIFASGLRNAAFTTINPLSNELWGTEMGRDYLGDNLPPDEINIIRRNKNYGWPFCYGNRIHDDNFDPNQSHLCTSTEPPVFEIPAHSAPLGLTFIHSPQFPTDWQNDLLVAYHGSWNRSIPTGYKIVHLKVVNNTITDATDFLTGFNQNGDILGRPVDMIFDSWGNLFVSDDKAGAVYIIQKQ